MIRGQQNKSVRWITGAMLATGIALASAGSAKAAPIMIPVTKCGTTISKPGFYQVTKSLSSAQAPGKDCIDISASNVILDILKNGNNTGNPCANTGIIGDSSSKSPIGIHILSTAKNVFIEGQNSNIAGWQTGIEDDGSGAIGDDFNAVNNVNVGLLLKGASGSSFSNFFAGILQDSNGADCFPVGIQGPQFYGVEFLNATNSQIFNAQSAGNAYYGVWTNDSSTNRISLVNAGPATGGTTFAGFWFGCEPTANVGLTCTPHGKNNLVYDASTDVTTSGGEVVSGQAQYGLVFEKGETGYIVTDNTAQNNFYDIYAINDPTCSANTYFFNFIDFGVPSCVTAIQ